MQKAQDGSMLAQTTSVEAYSSYSEVFELKTLGDLKTAIKTSGQRMMCVMFHNDNPIQEREFDQMKQEYTNVHLYKVNTLLSEDIRERHSDGSTKP